MSINFLKISLVLILINYCNTFEYRYVPNSEEYDKKLMLNSIFRSKNNKFVSRFDLNKLKHRRWDINLNDENRLDNIKPNKINKNDKFEKHTQNENFLQNELEESDYVQPNETVQEIDTTFSPNLLNLTNQVLFTTTSLPQLNSALSYDSKNYSEFIYQKPIETNLNLNNYTKKLPIYFTNPLTRIVYSITEVGYNYSEPVGSLNDNNSIPIYIPKEQYDRDMNLLKMEFMQQCRIGKNKKIQTKLGDLLKITSSTTKPDVIKPIKPQKTPVRIPVKKRKNQKPKSTEIDDDTSGPFSGIGDVFDDVFNVIEDSGSSSEEQIKNGIKLKLPNHNDKLIKSKIKNKPSLTGTFIKNGNQTLKIINNKFFRTQVEKPINKTTINPIIANTTMQSFVSIIPLRTSNITKDSIFSSRSFNRKISKRSIQIPKSTISSIFKAYKLIRKIVPIRSTISNNFVTEIPIVKYTTPPPAEFHTNYHRIFKRSLRTSTIKSQPLTTEITQTVNTIPIGLEHTGKMKKTKLKKVNETIKIIMNITTTTPFTENFTETSRDHQSQPTYFKYLQKENNKLKISSLKKYVTTATPLRTVTIPMVPAVTSPLISAVTSKKPKKQKIEHGDEYENEDEYEDYLINYQDMSFGDDYDKKDENSKEDNSYSDEESTESEEYSGHNLSEINSKDPKQNHWTTKHIEKKHRRKRKPENDENNYDDDDENDYNDGGDIGEFFKMFFYPARVIWENIATNTDDVTNNFNDPIEDDVDEDNNPTENNEKRKPKFPKYTMYKNKVSNAEEEISSSSWFTSWFGGGDDESNNNDNNSSESENNPSEAPPGWFDSWFGYNEHNSTTPATSTEDYDDDHDDDDDGYVPEWFGNWFDPSTQKKPTKIELPSPTTPLLTISNPMKNPQKWIGILAQHIVNSTATPNSITSPQFEDDEPQLITYDKYQIWRLKPFGESQVKVLERYKNSAEGSKLQWLQGPTLRGLTDVLVPPKLQTDLLGTLNFEDIAHEVLIFDVGKAIDYETKDNSLTDSARNAFVWKKYQSYDRIIRFIENLQMRNPNFIELFHIGRSYEGRPLVIVKIFIKETGGRKKLKLKQKYNNRNNGVFIEAGLHGREWITPASACWIINNIVRIMKSNQTTSDAEFIKKMTWYIIPVVNPDGYEYSHEYDRMWRKSRSKHLAKQNGLLNTAMTWFQQTKSEKVCFGVDLDQNWDYEWMGKGGSKSPCNEFFAGPNSFSEPETRVVSKFLMDHRKKIKLFISLQAYGQIISYPNKFNTTFNSQKMDDLLDVAMVGNDGLRKSGSNARYKIDSTNDLIATKSGSSTYFAMYEAGIPFSYTIHLGDNGVHGYLLPSSNIESTAKDAFQIIKAMIDYI